MNNFQTPISKALKKMTLGTTGPGHPSNYLPLI